jgi:TPR repeat protein
MTKATQLFSDAERVFTDAERADPDWQYEHGCWLYTGRDDTSEDAFYVEAAKWFRLAAEQGHAKAQRRIGAMYYEGEGVPQDYVETVKWYRLAADQGHAGAQFRLGELYDPDQGPRGIQQDVQNTEKWWILAADQGHAGAQFNLGVMYEHGPRPDREVSRARNRWKDGPEIYKARPSDPFPYFQGLDQDFVLAHKWYNLSANGADRDAVARRMTPEQIVEAQRLAREWRSTA